MYFILAFSITLVFLCRSRKRKSYYRYASLPAEKEEIASDNAKDYRKLENKKELARCDIENYEALILTYRKALEAIEEELELTQNAGKKTVLLSKQANIEAKIHSINRKITIAYQTLKEEL